MSEKDVIRRLKSMPSPVPNLSVYDLLAIRFLAEPLEDLSEVSADSYGTKNALIDITK